jgi:hypothetical protein
METGRPRARTKWTQSRSPGAVRSTTLCFCATVGAMTSDVVVASAYSNQKPQSCGKLLPEE